MTDDETVPLKAAPEPETSEAEPEPEPGPERRTLGRDLLAAGALAVVLAALGFPLAMLWQLISPRVEYVTVDGGWYSVETYSDGFVLGDLYFAGLGLILGIVVAIAAWTTMRERRGPVVLLGLVVGSVACQVVAWRIGRHEWEQFWEAVRAAPPGCTCGGLRRSCSSTSTRGRHGTRRGSGISQRHCPRSSSAGWRSWPSRRSSLTPFAQVGHVGPTCGRVFPNSGIPVASDPGPITLVPCSDALIYQEM
ncbi:hypothetical protein GCM10029992_58790 [Glycomyces albus]